MTTPEDIKKACRLILETAEIIKSELCCSECEFFTTEVIPGKDFHITKNSKNIVGKCKINNQNISYKVVNRLQLPCHVYNGRDGLPDLENSMDEIFKIWKNPKVLSKYVRPVIRLNLPGDFKSSVALIDWSIYDEKDYDTRYLVEHDDPRIAAIMATYALIKEK